ncbi:MAG TPA: ATP-binding protein [Acidimicrobiales bacterium]|nr:ATP-binding protein [Acidimicrobiales bacterium]
MKATRSASGGVGRDRGAVVRRVLVGSAAALALTAALVGVMLPLRAHLSIATSALVLVVPVVAGAAAGGFAAGMVATAIGFLAYDLFFIPPYGTLSVGAAQNWVALGIYALVTVVVARIVTQLELARAEAQHRAAATRRLFDLSELLVREASGPDLFDAIVGAFTEAFGLSGAALLLPEEGRLEVVASAGTPLPDPDLDRLAASARGPVSLESALVQPGGTQALALVASGREIGLLALRGLGGGRADHELLRTFANHAALALERARLREQALRAQLLEEVDRLRRSLVGAVSHDLRTPLATIKVSASTLRDPDAHLGAEEARELACLIDAQADRLDRLVANLLDMTRIQSGTLELRRRATEVGALVADAITVLGGGAELERVTWRPGGTLPLVDVDPVLARQALANLVDNALRHGPEGAPVTVTARWEPARRQVLVAVCDEGPGVAVDDHTAAVDIAGFQEAGGRGGLGLAIARAFLEAHGERLWVEDAGTDGARFVFSLAPAGQVPAELAAGG